ncbi:MAG: winged helix-turn-helix transcriptional regulator [Solirubrobacteraceae bacterium]
MLGNDYRRQDCSIARTLEVIGQRWTLLIIRDAFYGVQRFNDFQAHLDIPKAVLSDRLSGLVKNGILERRADSRHRGRHLYELTISGRDLWPVLSALLTWGEHHRHTNSRIFKHAACGTGLNGTGHCAACDVTPEPQDILTEPGRGRGKRREDPVAVALRAPHRLLEPIETSFSGL